LKKRPADKSLPDSDEAYFAASNNQIIMQKRKKIITCNNVFHELKLSLGRHETHVQVIESSDVSSPQKVGDNFGAGTINVG